MLLLWWTVYHAWEKNMVIDKVLNFIENTKFEDLPKEVISMSKKCLLDLIGVSFAGNLANSSKRAFSAFSKLDFSGNCTIIGFPKKVSSIEASFLNGTLSSCFDMDDGHRGAVGHPGCMVIPVVMAAAETLKKVNGKNFLLAVVKGYEIATRFGMVMNSNHEKMFYGSGGWAVSGAAAAAASIYGLKGETLKNAITIAENYAPTAQCLNAIRSGAMTKESVGWGAATAMMAVILAQAGFTGPDNVLQDSSLYQVDPEQIFNSLGENYEIKNTYFKLFPSCRWSHSPITAAISIKRKYAIKINQIEKIVIETFHKALTLNHVSPHSSEAAQYSIPYTVSAALVYGDLKPEHMMDQYLNHHQVTALARKIELRHAPDLEKMFPKKRPARVTIKTTDGKMYQEEVHLLKGDPENPLSWGELVDKFKQNTRMFIDPQTQRKIIDSVATFEAIEDIKDFTALLRSKIMERSED